MFLHKLGVVLSVDWIFIIVLPALWWLGKYVTFEHNICNLSKHEVAAASTFSSLLLSSRKPLLKIYHYSNTVH
jgi:hypothetical protein